MRIGTEYDLLSAIACGFLLGAIILSPFVWACLKYGTRIPRRF